MSLIAIKQHMMKVKMASLSSIAQNFKLDPEVLRHMLTLLLRKGCIRKMMKTPACGKTCNQCNVGVTEIYEWVS